MSFQIDAPKKKTAIPYEPCRACDNPTKSRSLYLPKLEEGQPKPRPMVYPICFKCHQLLAANIDALPKLEERLQAEHEAGKARYL